MQLGFGMQLGYMFVTGTHGSPSTFKTGCIDPLEEHYLFIMVPILACSFAILIDANWKQMPGSIFTCACGYLMSTYATNVFAVEIAPFLAAIAMTFAARLYAYYNNEERPLVYIIVGLFMLVPGGVGVKGMSNMWSGDIVSGMTFTFQMLLVGVCLAIGVFMALVPRKHCIRYRYNKNGVVTTQLPLSTEPKQELFIDMKKQLSFASNDVTSSLLTQGVALQNYESV